MATIVIPSKNIYEINNKKIRDNVVGQIEVGAVEIVPDNDYEVSVYNNEEENFYQVQKEYKIDFRKTYKSAPDNLNFVTAISCSAYKETELFEETKILIPILLKNKKIASIKLGSNSEGESNIKYNLFGIYKYGAVTCPYSGELSWISGNNYNFNVDFDISNCSFYEEIASRQEAYFIPKEFTQTVNGATWEGKHFDISITSSVKVEDISNLKTATITKETINGEEYIALSLKDILCGAKAIRMGHSNRTNAGVGTGFPISGTMTGTWEEYIPKYIEITVYGNTIGIDLQDKTVYIPETATTTNKKVISVEGNELMQTSNFEIGGGEIVERELSVGTDFIYYYTDENNTSVLINFLNKNFVGKEVRIRIFDEDQDTGSTDYYYTIPSDISLQIRYGYHIKSVYVYLREESDTNSIKKSFSKTQEIYNKGKETATIRCNLSDYYEYDATKANYKGTNKIIDILNENDLSQMTFRLYDEVVPLIYGIKSRDGNGNPIFGDIPMSVDANGNPKKFKVLGVKFFSKGTTWQEISLKEA